MAGQLLHRIVFSIFQFIAPSFYGYEGERTYSRNRKLEGEVIKGLITDQSKLEGMLYGDAQLSKSGCEAVAIYNVLMLKNRPKLMSDIIRDLQIQQTLVNRGRWGTNPFDMMMLLEEYNLNYEPMESVAEAEEKMKDGDMLLVTVWNHGVKLFKGIHGYVIRKISDSNYEIYNKNYRETPEKATTLKEAIGEGRYIVGYLIR
ncbi:MAG: hypothetical protein J6H21_01885 [Firmicutes bacterium]|nr:hypothetical protein [Bacillota bacterium]